MQIENKGYQPLSIAGRGMPFAGARAYLVPALHEGHTLKVTWQLPPVQGLYRKKADEYWSHLLGHEGPGSLLSALKARKWATSIYAGAPPRRAFLLRIAHAYCACPLIRVASRGRERGRDRPVAQVLGVCVGLLRCCPADAHGAMCGGRRPMGRGGGHVRPRLSVLQGWVAGSLRTTAGLRCLRWRSH